MRSPLLLSALLAACAGSSDPDPTADDTDLDSDSDTAQAIELPFETGTYTMSFIDAEIDLCGYGRLPDRRVTLAAGGAGFTVDLPGPTPGPAELACSLDGPQGFACGSDGDELTIEGAFQSETRGFGDLVDNRCSSFLPFTWERG